jgi:hypothetical protein
MQDESLECDAADGVALHKRVACMSGGGGVRVGWRRGAGEGSRGGI